MKILILKSQRILKKTNQTSSEKNGFKCLLSGTPNYEYLRSGRKKYLMALY